MIEKVADYAYFSIDKMEPWPGQVFQTFSCILFLCLIKYGQQTLTEAAGSGSYLPNEFHRERSVEKWLPPKGYISFVPSVLRGSM